ncbi:MAG: hypothetical protein NVSMB27_40300 [Ktedonobacteraceae bacterium]
MCPIAEKLLDTHLVSCYHSGTTVCPRLFYACGQTSYATRQSIAFVAILRVVKTRLSQRLK